jgi:hypothetical protein
MPSAIPLAEEVRLEAEDDTLSNEAKKISQGLGSVAVWRFHEQVLLRSWPMRQPESGKPQDCSFRKCLGIRAFGLELAPRLAIKASGMETI